jgi:NADH-quinone oxidoreductase subunit L
VFLTFHGDERYHALGIHPHEMYTYVLWALSPLAILAVIAGFFQGAFEHFVTHLLPAYHMSEETHHVAWILGLVVIAFAVGGIVLAYLKYNRGLRRNEKLEKSFLYRLLANQYYIPILYEKTISQPYSEISRVMWEEVDKEVVDATVDGIASVVESGGDTTRRIQTGNLSDYLKLMGAGALLLGVLTFVMAMQS